MLNCIFMQFRSEPLFLAMDYNEAQREIVR